MDDDKRDLLQHWQRYREPGYHTSYEPHWGMAIDLDKCTGCSACVTACQAENNLPIVGPDGFAEGREIKWLRIERYWQGEYPNIRLQHIPVLCQHCDAAPCETVCPVYATYHTPEGLNAQVYNRCIGTRSCAVYCPYEVRYFNWKTHVWEAPLEKQLNPEVTVREKGVMEKCSFCIQRIRAGKDKAKDEGRALVDGDVTPACVQSCPAKAMVFGDLNQADSEVSKWHASPRAFHLLKDLNTRPSIAYLQSLASMDTESQADPQDMNRHDEEGGDGQ